MPGRPPAGGVPHRVPAGHPPPRRPPLLRATVTRLILDDFTAAGAAPSTPREAGSAAALILAREDAGILEPAETAPVAAKVEAAIGADALDRLAPPGARPPTPTTTPAPWSASPAAGAASSASTPTPPRPPPSRSDPLRPADAIANAIDAISDAVEADFAPPPPPFPPGDAEARAEKAAAATPSGPPARSSAARPGPGRSPAPATPAKRRPPPPAA